MSEIVWIASYPKSGNTWLRSFLSYILFNEIDINQISTDGISSSRYAFEEITGLDSDLFTFDELDILKPMYFEQMSRFYQMERLLIKAHDAYYLNQMNTPIFNLGKVIHIVRNPFDVVVSYSHHVNQSIPNTIQFLNDSHYALVANNSRWNEQMRQILFSWKEHTVSWYTKNPLSTLHIRYEDMLNHPMKTFTSVLNFLDIRINEAKIIEALKMTSFSELKAQEELKGFKEKPVHMETFFRKGIIGDYKNFLSFEEIEEIKKVNLDLLKELKYCDEIGRLTF